jgi:hypothetical protein
MKSLAFGLSAAILLAILPAAARAQGEQGGAPPSAPRDARGTFHFTEVTLTDGDQAYDRAEIYVRVRPSGGGYTRADYLDQSGRRLGFYEAFRVVSQDESQLRAWAIRNFPDRTTGAR